MKNKILLSTLPALLLIACNSGTTTSNPPAPIPSPTPSPSTTYAYFLYQPATNESDSYTQCVATANGIESSTCFTVGLPGTRTGGQTISFNGNYAYIANNSESSYTQCQVNESGIESSTCTIVQPQVTGLNHIYQMAFNSSYVFIEYGNGYAQCSYSKSGLIAPTSCTSHTPNSISDGQGIAINSNYAYFALNDVESYVQCRISNYSIESLSCSSVALPNSPGNAQGIVLNGSYAYFANGSPSTYTQCPVGNDNSISSGECIVYTPAGNGALHNAQQVAINGSYAYFANAYGNTSYYTQCLVTASGIESSTCTNYTPGAYESDAMRGISFYALPN